LAAGSAPGVTAAVGGGVVVVVVVLEGFLRGFVVVVVDVEELVLEPSDGFDGSLNPRGFVAPDGVVPAVAGAANATVSATTPTTQSERRRLTLIDLEPRKIRPTSVVSPIPDYGEWPSVG
jgi:hypothetical protein